LRRTKRGLDPRPRKGGQVREAHLIENEFVKGEWTDEVVLAIRKSQWEDSKAGERG
jgi:hypothetical protein